MMKKINNHLGGFFFLLILVLLIVGCSNKTPYNGRISFSDTENLPQIRSVKSNSQQPLRIAITTILSPTETIFYYRAIAQYLGNQLGRPVILLQRKNYAEVGLLLVNGGADMAFLSTGAYSIYANLEGSQVLVGQQRMGVPSYQCYIIVAKDSPITSLMELKGATMAFTDPLSYSGHLYFANKLREKGETPEHFLGQFIYTYSPEKALQAVNNKLVEAASISSWIYEYTLLKNPEIVNNIKIIAVSPHVGIGPVVVGRTIDAEQREVLRTIFLQMHNDPILKPLLQGLLIDRFIPFQPELYNDIHPFREKGWEL